MAQARLEAIDVAVDTLGSSSFVDLDMGQPLGAHALYAIDKPRVRSGVLADARRGRPRDQILSAIEHATERPGLRVVDGDPFTAATIAEIGSVDAAFLFNLLLHAAVPDWRQVLELYASDTSCFVVANPQWREGEDAVRLIELGREPYLAAVPPSARHERLFDRLDAWHPTEKRPHRDAMTVWQWGITDRALSAELAELGFHLEYERSLGSFPGAEAFESKTFVFAKR